MPATGFTCCLRDVEGLAAVIELVGDAFNKEHAKLQLFKERGLQVQAIDQSQTSFLDAWFQAHGSGSIFSRFACTEDVHSVWLDPGLAAKALRSAGGSTVMTGKTKLRTDVALSLAEGGGFLHFEFDSVTSVGVRKRCKHSLALFDPSISGDEVEINGADFNFTSEAFFDAPSLLQEVVAQLKTAGCEEVTLRVSQEALTFTSVSSTKMMEAEITLYNVDSGSGGHLAISCEQDFSATFAFRYIVRLAKLCKSSNKVLLQMAAESPLSAVFDLKSGGTCQVFLAPMLEDAEDVQEHV